VLLLGLDRAERALPPGRVRASRDHDAGDGTDLRTVA
jgi:hypothetical protein